MGRKSWARRGTSWTTGGRYAREGSQRKGAHTLLSTYAQGCRAHLLRANYETGWVGELDELLFGAYAELTN